VATLARTPPLTAGEVEALAAELEPLSAEAILAWAAERFGERLVLTCSWQKQSSILVHLAASVAPGMRIVELNTGLLFTEALDTRDRLVERYGLEVETIRPELTLGEQERLHGKALWERDPDACCGLRKVAPLERALAGMEAWVTGIRRSQSATRARLRKLELDERRGVVKVLPLADWSDKDCWRFIHEHGIPYNELHDRDFPSIGCAPCTRAVRPGESERAGRWAGRAKSECGLHG
jgi:phosphoadenosine phosphosulfate reductase